MCSRICHTWGFLLSVETMVWFFFLPQCDKYRYTKRFWSKDFTCPVSPTKCKTKKYPDVTWFPILCRPSGSRADDFPLDTGEDSRGLLSVPHRWVSGGWLHYLPVQGGLLCLWGYVWSWCWHPITILFPHLGNWKPTLYLPLNRVIKTKQARFLNKFHLSLSFFSQCKYIV